jgi:hypothetical protein
MGKASRVKRIRREEKAAQAEGGPMYQGRHFSKRDYDMLVAGYRTAAQLAGLSGFPQKGVERLLDIGIVGFLGGGITNERVAGITGMSDGMVQGFLAALNKAKQAIYVPTAEEQKMILEA